MLSWPSSHQNPTSTWQVLYQSFRGIFNFSILQGIRHSGPRRQAGSKEWDHLTRSTRGRVEGLQTALRTKLTSSQDQADGCERMATGQNVFVLCRCFWRFFKGKITYILYNNLHNAGWYPAADWGYLQNFGIILWRVFFSVSHEVLFYVVRIVLEAAEFVDILLRAGAGIA